MVKFVKKRDGRIVPFNKNKIITAISKAGFVPADLKNKIAEEIEAIDKECLGIEEIQNMVEDSLMIVPTYRGVAKEYIRYRFKRGLIRKSESTNNSILDILNLKNQDVSEENSNKNPVILSTQRDCMAGEVSKDLSMKLLLPDDIVEAHKKGIIHFHDADYFSQKIFNCSLINLEDMLQNSTVINGTMIEKPHSFATACNIATQIMAQIASNQYGGQSITLSHLAPFVDVSRQKLIKECLEEFRSVGIDPEDSLEPIVETRLKREIAKGVQTMQYQINTLMTSNGQTPFVTLFMYLNEVKDEQTRADLAMVIEEVLRQRIKGVKNEVGAYITPSFPKLIYVLEENNIFPGSKYYELTKLSAQCTAKRMVPDYVSEKKMLEGKIDKNGVGHCYAPMGCRSFLTPYVDEDGKPKYWGRFNCGVVTINLADVALSSNGDFDKFWEIFEDRLELCHRALQCRHQHLRGTISDVSPIHWQYGAIARLKKGETIDKLLYNGYCTISLGYAGLYECVKAMTGKSHTDVEAKPFALAVMLKLNDKCAEWKSIEHIDYSVYGTPIESTTYKFARALRKRFGIIKGITDHDYITNSYHVNVREKIDAFTKLKFESDFQALSPGGAISYIETSNLENNVDAILEVLKYIYDNIMYAEINTKSDYCHECGYNGEIQIVKDEKTGRLVWECPNCGNRDQRKMNVCRRTCGYLGSQFWNQGRTEEIKDRYVHLGNDD